MTVAIPIIQESADAGEGGRAHGRERGEENGTTREAYADGVNPVLKSSEWAVQELDLVTLHDEGIKSAARYIHAQMQRESYVPRTWRTHPLHIFPADPFSWTDPSTRACLNWVFLISALNFSFWSELEGTPARFGVEWRDSWNSDRNVVHTGYWSLVAALNRALEEGIPITDPTFYSCAEKCPDALLKHVFRPVAQSTERIPLLRERIAIMRQVGTILCTEYDGSFYGFIEAFRRQHNNRGTALQLVKMVTRTFPSFRDEHMLNGRRVYLWKRAQILVAETWAAFYPATSEDAHPLFQAGAAIHELTMFADYRVPQILHHLRMLSYPPSLVKLLNARTPLQSGSAEELSIRAASIVAVERVRREISTIIARERLQAKENDGCASGAEEADDENDAISSVMIDFYLWDLAKHIEGRPEGVEGVLSVAMLPIHRTRSIWY